MRSARSEPTARTEIYAGICGFTTKVHAGCADKRHVKLRVESECPDVLRIRKKLEALAVDARQEIGPCDQPVRLEDSEIMRICDDLPN